MTTTNPNQIVFIDSRVPDIQDLLNGLAPGEHAFVIDPSSDGLQQIANILAAQNLMNLASISIVSHGESGELELGSSFITDANLGVHSNALAEIGASLAPGGTIQLYGCDVAQGPTGQQFIDDFSTFTGGAPVEAATHLVGSAAQGGSWTLDASSNAGSSTGLVNGNSAPVGGASVPSFAPAALNTTPDISASVNAGSAFMPAALASYSGALNAAPDPEIWVADLNSIVHVDDNGGPTSVNSTTLYSGNSNFHSVEDVVLDPTDGVYFILDDTASNGVRILEGSLTQALNNPGAAPLFTTIFADTSTADFIPQIALDTVSHQLYFVDINNFNTGSAEISKFERLNYNATGLTTNASPTILSTVGPVTNGGVTGFALDLVNHEAVFAFNQGGFVSVTTTPATPFLFAATGLTPSASTVAMSALPINGGSTFPTSLGFFTQDGGLAIDPNTHVLYFTLTQGSAATTGGLYKYNLASNPTGSFSNVFQETSSSNPSVALNSIVIDPTTSNWYGSTDAIGSIDIWRGSLSGGAPTVFETFSGTNGSLPLQLWLDQQPTLSITPVAGATWIEEQASVQLITGATATDPDNGALASATVSISGGFFAGDTLSFTNNNNVAGSYNSSTGVLVFSGVDTFADYQTALDSVRYNGGENPTDFGSDNSRTLTWSVNDGLLTSAPSTSTVSVVGVNDPPTLSNVAPSAHFTEEGGAVTLSPTLSVVDVDDLNLSSATVSITGGTFANDGDVLSATTTGTSITASYDSTTERLTLSGTDTLAHYKSVLDSVTFTTGENPTNFGANTTRTLTWVATDPSGTTNGGTNVSTLSTTTISITNVNDPPTLSNVATSASWTEEGSVTTLSGVVSIADPDNLGLASATVSITGGKFANDQDVLSATGNGTIGVSYDSTNERLILSGSDTLANYQTVLDSVTFNAGENPTDFGLSPNRTITWVLNDGSGSNNLSTAATTTVSITNVNDPPTLSNVATNASFTEGAAAATLSGALSVTDPDSANLASATVSITGGKFTGDGDVLSFNTAGTSITATYDSTTEKLVLTGSDILAHYQTVLDSITFNAGENPTNFGANPTRTVTWQLDDGSTPFNQSNVATTTVSITNVNDPPTLSNVATSASWTEEGTATTLSGALSVTDPDDQTLASATVSVTGGGFAGDVLSATPTGGISVSYDSTNERLILTGSDTLANYQSVLDSVIFNAGENPTNFGANTTRTVTWVLNDGSSSNSLSTAVTSTISITNVNDQPTLSNVVTLTTVTAQTTATLSPGLVVTDPDNQKLASATVSITGGRFAGDGDVLSATATGSITVSYDTTNERLILSGSDTLANYQTVLNSVTFDPNILDPTNGGLNPTRTVTWVLNDGGSSNNFSTVQTETVSVPQADIPPTLSNVAASAAWTEESAATTLSPSITVSDPDGVNTDNSATVSITGGTFAGDGDVLAATTTSTSITASYNSTTETLTLTGSDTLAHYQQVLDSVTFNAGENPTNFGANPTRTLTWVIADHLNVLSTAQTETVSITNVNDPPTLSNVATSATFTEHGAAVTLSGGLSVTDPDNQKLASATVSITGGTFAGDGDVLSATGNGTIIASYDSANERLILSGSDTLANYQSVLDSVVFSAGENPTNFGANPTRTVTWVLNDGSSSFAQSTAVTSTVSITNVNDPPTLSNVATNASFTEGAGAVTLASGLLVSDPDDNRFAGATVSITGGAFTGDLLATNTTGTAITASYNSSTETLILSGTDTLADYQHVLDQVTFNSTSLNPDDFGTDKNRTVTWVINDGSGANNLNTAVTTTVGITAVNNPPTLSNVATSANFVESGGTVTLASGVSVTDPDDLKLASATVSITGLDIANGTFSPSGQATGDLLAFSTSGTSISASYNSTTETLTLTGSDTLANYQTVLDSVAFNSTNTTNPTNSHLDPTRTVTWVLNDGSGSNNFSTAVTTTVSITATNLPPTLSNVATSAHFTEAGAAVTLSNAVSVSDPDDLKLASATVSISGGTFANDGDMLAVSTAGFPNITASYNSMTETLTLTGSDTLADYQNVLDKVTFNSTSLNPTNFGSNPSRLVSWLLNDGGTSNNLSTPLTTTVGITAVNNPPALAGVAASLSVTVANAAILSSAVTVSDPDDLTLAHATVSVSGGSGDTLATSTAGTSIAASYNSSTETLTLTGADTLAHYQSVLDQVTFTGTAVGMRTVSWVLDDGHTSNNLSTAQTEMLSIVQPADQNLFGMVTHDVTSPGGDIYALYETILGRAPDALGYEFWTAQLEGGAPLTLIAQDFLASPEYTLKFGPFTQSSDSSFVDQLYQNGLHRHAEPAGLTYWDTQLGNGANSRPQTAVDIALSQEAQTDLAPVFQAGVFVPSQADAEIARLFYGVLGRAPDPNGLAYWENDFAQGDSLTKIASDFLNSAEYTQSFGTPNNTQFVNALYEGALGRSPDPMGGQYWINSLDQGASRASVAVNIAESPEAMSHLSSQIEAGFKIV
ncbi:protein of unknown function [Rhizobiales bacterium GAS191]|nr:protein of unknown function [Rhizobiales bacterium GAS191]